MKYTREDVIKAAILLKEYCSSHSDCSKECVFFDSDETGCLICDPTGASCNNWDIPVIKKENKEKQMKSKTVVPLDFSLEEDRKQLRNKIILHANKLNDCLEECIVEGYVKHRRQDYWSAMIRTVGCSGLLSCTSKELLENFTYVDTGKPVGKEVEE